MISQGLDLSLKQELKINAQLLQTMETLSLSTEELREKIKKEAETNPAIIIHENTASYDTLASQYRMKTDRRENFSDDAPFFSDDKEESNWIEGMVSKRETLQEHLLSELGMMQMDDDTRRATETLITSLDRNGFLPAEPLFLLKKKEQPYAEKATEILQSMEPEGVGARNWRESLIIQARLKGMKGTELELFKSFVVSELEKMKAGKTEQVARELGIEKEDVEAMFSFLKTLTPFPGRKYDGDYDEYIVPELSIKKDDNGHLRLQLNKNALPLVEIDSTYTDMAAEFKDDKTEEGKAAEKFIKEKLNSASSLINQLEMRASTLEKTGAVLMEKQKDFFLMGPKYMKGLTMQEAAAEVGVHEATISRIAASKYIDTDFGIYPIRMLFSNKVESASGENYSKNAVKEIISEIINTNTTGKPLSDQKISDILAKRGIKAARRTVSKYRHELDIDSSFERSK